MAYKFKLNPFTGFLDYVFDALSLIGSFEALVLEDAASPGVYDVLFDNTGNMLYEVTF